MQTKTTKNTQGVAVMNMKKKILSLLALLAVASTGAWAQDPDPIDLTPSAAASTVGLLTDADNFSGERVKSIVFYLSE